MIAESPRTQAKRLGVSRPVWPTETGRHTPGRSHWQGDTRRAPLWLGFPPRCGTVSRPCHNGGSVSRHGDCQQHKVAVDEEQRHR